MPYTREKPRASRTADQLRQSIPGWGVDLAPESRPSYPKEKFEVIAPWEFPERQPEITPRERSTEHKFLTPVFGTAQPLRGVSGAIRRYAYTFSEGRLAHWLLLIVGDRVDVLESRVLGVLSGRADNPITESGVTSEFEGQAYRTRFGEGRADLKHQPIDLLLWALPYIGIATGAYLLMKSTRPTR